MIKTPKLKLKKKKTLLNKSVSQINESLETSFKKIV